MFEEKNVNNVDKGTMTKCSVQKQTHRKTQKHVQYHDATDIQKTTIFSFWDLSLLFFFSFNFFNKFTSKELNIYVYIYIS